MEDIKGTLDSLSQLFGGRMALFEQELNRLSPARTPTAGTLAAEFQSFKSFILSSFADIQKQISLLGNECDAIEMRTRRKMLLLHGVQEQDDEMVVDAVAEVIQKRIGKSDFKAADISRAHRMGRPGDKARPILVKFHSLETRDETWFAKTGLKGSGITVSEFLTRRRHHLFKTARERLGISRCWTREGRIVGLDSSGRRHSITAQADLDRISPAERQDKRPAPVANAEEPGPGAVKRRVPTSARRVRGHPTPK